MDWHNRRESYELQDRRFLCCMGPQEDELTEIRGFGLADREPCVVALVQHAEVEHAQEYVEEKHYNEAVADDDVGPLVMDQNCAQMRSVEGRCATKMIDDDVASDHDDVDGKDCRVALDMAASRVYSNSGILRARDWSNPAILRARDTRVTIDEESDSG